MTVQELYEIMNTRIPESLSEPWDNDGIMCSPDLSCEVGRVIITLDVTDEIVDYAISKNIDLIVSHHPLIFHPINRVTEQNYVSRKLVKLITNGISVFSFHTRLDKAVGGVNDILARTVGLADVVSFGEGGLGRIGILSEECDLDVFADRVKNKLSSDCVKIADAYNPVKRVAVVGGEGKDFVEAAIASGADTFLSGRVGYHMMQDASDMGINLIEAGHYFTEFPVTDYLANLVLGCCCNASVEIADSNMIKTV